MVDAATNDGRPDASDIDTQHITDPETLDPNIDPDSVKLRGEDNGLLRTVVVNDDGHGLCDRDRAMKIALPGSDVPGDDLVTDDGTVLAGDGDVPNDDLYHNPSEYPRYVGERSEYDDVIDLPLDSGNYVPVCAVRKVRRTGHVRGRVVRVDESDEDLSDDATLLLADESGTATVKLPSGLDYPDLHRGEQIVMTYVERTDEDSRDERLVPTVETDVVAISRDKTPPGYWLQRRSELVNAAGWYCDCEKDYNARAKVVKTILDELNIESPRGEDDLMLYVDAPQNDLHGTWTSNGEDVLKEMLQDYLPARKRTDREKAKIVNEVRDSTRVPEDAWEEGAPDHEDLQWTVGVENGVIDLRTGDLKPHGPEWKLRQKLPVEYRPDEYDGLGDELDWFLGETMKEDADRESFLYMLGHALARCYPAEAIWSLIGPGENGKTRLLEVIECLLGDSMHDFDLKIMTGDSDFGGNPLKGAQMAIDDDATDVKMKNTGLLKKQSGGRGGQINAKNDQMDGSGYDNYGTIVFLSNNPPMFADKSNGMFRRMHPILMPYQFTDDPTDEHKNGIPKTELQHRIQQTEEIEALLVEAVKYAGKLSKASKVKDGRSKEERVDIYESYSDNILRFWTECMTPETGARVSRNAVYEVYVQFCDRHGIDPQSAGGRNGFWPLSDQCHGISYNREDVWLDGSRAVEHVKFSAEAMEYAPDWVAEKWEADIDDEEDTLANRLDRVTPLADLGDGYCTVEATVIHRGHVGDEVGTKLVLEDHTTAIDAICWGDEFDGVMPGDTVRLTRAVLSSDDYGVPQLQPTGPMDVEVIDPAPLSDEEDEGKELDDDVIDPDSEDDEVMTPTKIIDRLDDGDGVTIDDVKSEMCNYGWERAHASREIDRLKAQGVLTEPADGKVRTV